jgi:hypothetical protein
MISPQMKKQFGGPRGRWKETTTMNECFLRYREDLTGFRVGRLAASIEDDNKSYDFLKRRKRFDQERDGQFLKSVFAPCCSF